MDTLKRLPRLTIRMVREYLEDDGPFLAAGIAFYAFFSLIPLVLISVAVLAHFWEGEQALHYTLDLSSYFVPETMVVFLHDTLTDIMKDRKKLGVVGVLMLLWSGRMLFRAMELSLHKAWDIPLNRSFFTGNLLAMLMVLLCGAVVFTVGWATAALTWIHNLLLRLPRAEVAGFSLDQTSFWLYIHSWLVVPLATFTIFLLIYVILPSRQVPLIHAVPGALFSALAWRFSSYIYLEYIVEFGRQNPLYGSIWGIIGLLVWLYIEATVFLLGAELVFVILHDQGGKRKRRT